MTYLVLFTSLTIAGVAAYYSIIGLMTIFAGAAIPIAIMGSSLEIGKLVTASWLHQNWKKVPLFMKTYLTLAVVTLMIITSLGIFGFLSRAHVEQMTGSDQAQAKVERVDEQIARLTARVNTTKEKIERIDSKETDFEGSSTDRAIKVQEEIRDSAWDRVGSAIKREEDQIKALQEQLVKDVQIQQDRIEVARSRVQEDVQVKERSITRANDRIKQLDSDVRAIADKGVEKGAFGGITKDWTVVAAELRESQEGERASLNAVILAAEKDINNLREREIAVSREVQEEITKLRAGLTASIKPLQDKIDSLRVATQEEIKAANEEIKRLQEQELIQANQGDESIALLEKQIEVYYIDIDKLKEDRFALEAGLRDLEAEVGPLKYVAELIYGDEAKDHFDEAVRWVIILIIVTFDPLAIMLLLAANMGFREKKQSKMFHDDGSLRVEMDNVVDVEDALIDVTNEIPADEDIEDYEISDVADEPVEPREQKGIKLKIKK